MKENQWFLRLNRKHEQKQKKQLDKLPEERFKIILGNFQTIFHKVFNNYGKVGAVD